jgi:methylated-DNA-protein-cysteine methyltransferase-like protein
MASYFDDVYHLVRQIPYGKIATYGRVAQWITVPRGARGVGWALYALTPDQATVVPWWRVVNAAGRISNEFNATLQRELLEAEGVRFTQSGTIDLKQFLWEGPSAADMVQSLQQHKEQSA